jgi:uncharacterized membrane protein
VKLSVRKIVVAGLMGAIAIFLAVTRLGFIPVPNVAGSATIMHVPVVLAAVLEGPMVGFLVGAIFGIFSWLQATTALFADPLVAVLPRLFIGITSYFVYKAFERNQWMALVAAGITGTLTNTILVLGMAVLRKYIAPAVVITIVPQAIAELVIAVILTVAIGMGAQRMRSGGSGTDSSKERRAI